MAIDLNKSFANVTTKLLARQLHGHVVYKLVGYTASLILPYADN